MKRTKNHNPLSTREIMAHPHLPTVRVNGLNMENRIWSYEDAVSLHPLLTAEQFRKLTLDQQTRLAGELFIKRQEDIKQDMEKKQAQHPDFFGHNSGQPSRVFQSIYDYEETAETSFNRAKRLSVDWIIEKAVMSVEAIKARFSKEKKVARYLAKLDMDFALTTTAATLEETIPDSDRNTAIRQPVGQEELVGITEQGINEAVQGEFWDQLAEYLDESN